VLWLVPGERRDLLIVREPEEEELATYEARAAELAAGSGIRMAAVPL
jgi:hypothetical protein